MRGFRKSKNGYVVGLRSFGWGVAGVPIYKDAPLPYMLLCQNWLFLVKRYERTHGDSPKKCAHGVSPFKPLKVIETDMDESVISAVSR